MMKLRHPERHGAKRRGVEGPPCAEERHEHSLVKEVPPRARFASSVGMTFVMSLLLAGSVNAQLPIPSFAIVGGVSHFDLSGTGSTPTGALRVDVPLLSLVAEGSLGIMRPKEDDGTRTYIIPEAQLQYQLLPILVKPYIGVGAGMFKAVSGPDPHHSDLALSAALGVRASVPLTGLGLQLEGRVRGIGSGFRGSTTELTLGVTF